MQLLTPLALDLSPPINASRGLEPHCMKTDVVCWGILTDVRNHMGGVQGASAGLVRQLFGILHGLARPESRPQRVRGQSVDGGPNPLPHGVICNTHAKG